MKATDLKKGMIVRIISTFDIYEDSFIEVGMKFVVLNITTRDSDGCIYVEFDCVRFREHNTRIAGNTFPELTDVEGIYFDADPSKLVNCFELISGDKAWEWHMRTNRTNKYNKHGENITLCNSTGPTTNSPKDVTCEKCLAKLRQGSSDIIEQVKEEKTFTESELKEIIRVVEREMDDRIHDLKMGDFKTGIRNGSFETLEELTKLLFEKEGN